ncbi:MAG: serine hydrolase, partial [Ferruginibacter sp.]|nr:serine hydrolase [Ferruginibacter sp.]
MRIIFLFFGIFFGLTSYSQIFKYKEAEKWADSVYNTLNEEEKIGQLIVARLSTIEMKSKKVKFYFEQVLDNVKKYNIGGVCIFQGSPAEQAEYMNRLKKEAKTPILFSIDGEWGVGMRFTDSVMPLPKQMMMGAIQDSSVIYAYGKVVANQCKRMGIQCNYAPVVDVNNNPNNPVINDRSFGEDKYKVASFAIQYMKGLQENGILACAKHFPGHGDVAVDSHLDLPIINKTKKQLDSTELYPFKKIIDSGVGSMMIGHLYIPSIDSRTNRSTSLSDKNIQGILRNELKFEGIAITDALEMQGVKKFFPNDESSVEALIAGNDQLCLPENIPMAIQKIKKALKNGKIKRSDLEQHCKKILMAKYHFVKNNNEPINTLNLTSDLNKETAAMRKTIAENAITLVSNEGEGFFPLKNTPNIKVAYVGFGINSENEFSKSMRKEFGASVFYIDYSKKNTDSLKKSIDSLIGSFDKIILGIHQINRAPANNFGISNEAVESISRMQKSNETITFLFGNAYAAKNWCDAKNLVIAYEDDSIVQHTAAEMLRGRMPFKGVLPVTVCDNLKYGKGIKTQENELGASTPQEEGFNPFMLLKIDSIVEDGIKKKAMPGCCV